MPHEVGRERDPPSPTQHTSHARRYVKVLLPAKDNPLWAYRASAAEMPDF
jgi:hypothetical protein